MTYADQQVYPSAKQILGSGMDYHEIPAQPGITKREHFAHTAPPVPDWFSHIPAPKDFKDTPDWKDIKIEADAQICRDWVHDGYDDLPEHLMWFQEAFNKSVETRDRYNKQEEVNRYFQWRTFYADSLINNLNQSVA